MSFVQSFFVFDYIIMERKPNVLIVESSEAIGKRLMDLLDKLNGLAEILYASTAGKAFDLILHKKQTL